MIGDIRLPDRFWGKVEACVKSGCWLWKGTIGNDGYGQFWLKPKKWRAHRIAYETLVSPVPADLVIDHLCRNRVCVNPAHLEPVTVRENLLRGETLAAKWLARAVCSKGHSLKEAYLRKDGTRRCRICHAAAEYERNRSRRSRGFQG